MGSSMRQVRRACGSAGLHARLLRPSAPLARARGVVLHNPKADIPAAETADIPAITQRTCVILNRRRAKKKTCVTAESAPVTPETGGRDSPGAQELGLVLETVAPDHVALPLVAHDEAGAAHLLPGLAQAVPGRQRGPLGQGAWAVAAQAAGRKGRGVVRIICCARCSVWVCKRNADCCDGGVLRTTACDRALSAAAAGTARRPAPTPTPRAVSPR